MVVLKLHPHKEVTMLQLVKSIDTFFFLHRLPSINLYSLQWSICLSTFGISPCLELRLTSCLIHLSSCNYLCSGSLIRILIIYSLNWLLTRTLCCIELYSVTCCQLGNKYLGLSSNLGLSSCLGLSSNLDLRLN